MSRRRVLSMASGLCLASLAAAAEPAPEVLAAAKLGLEQFKRLVTEKSFREFGFETAEEPRRAALGEPLPEFMVRLDELREYAPGLDPMKLLKGGDRYLFPVTAGGRVRASMMVARSGERWQAVSFGRANSMRVVEGTIQRGALEARRPALFLVRVPALYRLFVGFVESGKLVLVETADDPAAGLEAGKAVPGERAFEALSKLARELRPPGK